MLIKDVSNIITMVTHLQCLIYRGLFWFEHMTCHAIIKLTSTK